MSTQTIRNDGDSEDWDIVSPEEVQRLVPRDGNSERSPPDDGGSSTEFRLEVKFLGLSCELTATNRRTTREGAEQPPPPSRPAAPQPSTLGPTNPQLQSPLFALPTELRLQIWEHLLTLLTPTTSTEPFYGIPMSPEPHLCPNHRRLRPPSILSILQTCRLAHTEAQTLFYSLNRLHADPRIAAARLSPPRRAAVAAMTMTVTVAQEMTSVARALRSAEGALPGLRSLWFVRTQTIKFLDPRPWAVMSYQTAGELRGAKEGGCRLLSEVRVITPEEKYPTNADRERWARLRIADERIEAAVRS